jgi:hypothetical protein
MRLFHIAIWHLNKIIVGMLALIFKEGETQTSLFISNFWAAISEAESAQPSPALPTASDRALEVAYVI